MLMKDQKDEWSSSSICLVCCDKIDNISKNKTTKVFAKVLANRFRVFCKYVKLDCKLSTDKFDFSAETFPFCKLCKSLVLKLCKYDQDLRLVNKRIANVSCKVTARMLESRDRVATIIVPLHGGQQNVNLSDYPQSSCSLVQNSEENVEIPSEQSGKIYRLREFIFNRYNAQVSLQKLEPSTKTSNLESRQLENSDAALRINEQDEQDQILMQDSDNLLENVKLAEDEPWSIFSIPCDSFTSETESSEDGQEKDLPLTRKSNKRCGTSTRHQREDTVEVESNKFLFKNELMLEKVSSSQFKCSYCEFLSESRRSIINHIRRKHLNAGVYVCETCGKNFAQKQFLKSHQETHSSVRSHLCHHCGQSFKTRPTLVKHMIRHRELDRNVKRFQCEECGQKFTQNKSLKLHKAIHSNDLPFECEKCQKKFRQQAHLIRHQNTHLGAKPFACDQCDVRFTMKQSVLRHIQSVHNKIPRKSSSSSSAKSKSETDTPLAGSSGSGSCDQQVKEANHLTSNNLWTNWAAIAQPDDLIIQAFPSEVPTTTLVYITP